MVSMPLNSAASIPNKILTSIGELEILRRARRTTISRFFECNRPASILIRHNAAENGRRSLSQKLAGLTHFWMPGTVNMTAEGIVPEVVGTSA